jgi:HK97 family phage portal protein
MLFKKFAQMVRSSAAKMFTWPNRYYSTDYGPLATDTGVPVTPENSLTCSAVASCVRLLSDTIAALPLHVYRDQGKSKTVAIDHQIYSLIHSAPNEFQTSFTWVQEAITHCLLHGNFYAFIERDTSGNPVALWPLNPYGMMVEAVEGAVYYRYFYGGQRSEFPFSDILHFKGLTLNGLLGLSVVQMAKQGIGLSFAQEQHAASLFKNNARPGLVIQFPGFLTDVQRQNYGDSFGMKFAGALNSGKTIVLEGGMKIEPVGFTAEDSQFLESRHFSVIEIARWFRVPPTMIGDMTRVSYSSSESEMQLFAMHSLVPWCANLEAEMNAKLLPAGTPFYVKFDVNSIVRGDQQSRYTAYSQGLTAGFLTVADVRAAEGLPYISGTESLNRPANMVPNEGGNSASIQPAA